MEIKKGEDFALETTLSGRGAELGAAAAVRGYGRTEMIFPRAWVCQHPLLHLGKYSHIRIEPVALNDGEFQFVEGLKGWLERNQQAMAERGEQLYLLRNLVKLGIGFFEAGGFYPDFILWHVHEDGQRIIFVDPHGLRHTGSQDEKIQFSERIKDVERRLKNDYVELESVILAPSSTTREWITSHWGMTAEELRDKHVFFMSDSDYLDQLMRLTASEPA